IFTRRRYLPMAFPPPSSIASVRARGNSWGSHSCERPWRCNPPALFGPPANTGYIYISANTPHFWKALCELVGLPELANDPRYDTIRKRAQRADELVPKLRQALQRRSATEWEELFGDRVPCSAIRRIEDMFDHPQVLAEGMVACFEHPIVGKFRGFYRPIKFSATPGAKPTAAPTLGQHSEKILARFGYSPGEIREMLKNGVVVGSDLAAPQHLHDGHNSGEPS